MKNYMTSTQLKGKVKSPHGFSIPLLSKILLDFFFLAYFTLYKVAMITLYARQQKRHRCREQTFGLCGRGRGWDDLGE